MIRKAERQGGQIPKTAIREECLRFSFQYFSGDDDLCPGVYTQQYTEKLIERLRDLSSWTISRFVTRCEKAVRNHRIQWDETGRPDGFAHLPQQLRDCEAWQFNVTSNEHGRVHGLLIDSTFYVIWLDCNHRLYR